MEVVHPRCCGMDISKTDAKVCIRTQNGARASTEVTTWSAVSSQVLALAGVLCRAGVSLVVMEATSDYWKPFYFLLTEVGLNVMLVNPRLVRQIPGRKTDVADATRLADLGAHGLLRGSFVAPPAIRELKDLVRARTILVRLRSQEKQRLEKLLESAAIKLSSTISDITGASGRRMLEALIAGVNDSSQLAQLAHVNIKATAEELQEALTGRFTGHHGFLAQMHLDLIDDYDKQIEAVEQQIQACFAAEPGEQESDIAIKRDLLTTIPGIASVTAEKILAEIGIDMTVFPTAKQLTSWAGIAPGANESAGKVKSTKCRPGNTYLKGALGAAAQSIARSKRSFFAARYKKVASRRGHNRALVAVQRAMLTAVWTVLTTGQPYIDRGADYYAKQHPGTIINKAVNQLTLAGVQITFTSPNTAVIS